MSGDAQDTKLIVDEPISTPSADRFRRTPLAAQISRVVQTVVRDGPSAVVAIVGPWGSGKTSLLSLVRQDLDRHVEDLRIVEFNPWLVGSVEGLVADFFASVINAIDDTPRRRWKRNRSALLRYAKAVTTLMAGFSVPGAGAGAALSGAAEHLSSGDNLHDLRARAQATVSNGGKPIVIVIDDLDRLHKDELLVVFKLIRLVGRLEGIHYVLSFDEQTIINLLTASDLTGNDPRQAADFLEKIIQVRIDMPPLDRADIDALVHDSLDAALAASGVTLSEHEQTRFDHAYQRWLRPHLAQPRRIKRLFSQVHATLPLIRNEVDVADFIILTFVRLNIPTLYNALPGHAEELLGSPRVAITNRRRSDDEREADWRTFIEAANVPARDRDLARHLLAELFPGARLGRGLLGHGVEPLRSERRIGTIEYFDRYFQLGIPPDDLPDARFRSAAADLAEGRLSDERQWLFDTLVAYRAFALGKLHDAWIATERDPNANSHLIQLLLEAYAALDRRSHDHWSTLRWIEHWIPDLLGEMSTDDARDVLASIIRTRSDLHALIAGLAGEGDLSGTLETAGRAALDGLSTELRRATSIPLSEDEEVLWMLFDAATFAGRDIVHGWLRDVLDVTTWTTLDLVGCFTPIGQVIGIEDSPTLSDFQPENLRRVFPLHEIIERLGNALTEPDPAMKSMSSPLDDVSFARRVEAALAGLRRLVHNEPALAEPTSMAVSQHAVGSMFGPGGASPQMSIRAIVARPHVIATNPGVTQPAVGTLATQERELTLLRIARSSVLTDALDQHAVVVSGSASEWECSGTTSTRDFTQVSREVTVDMGDQSTVQPRAVATVRITALTGAAQTDGENVTGCEVVVDVELNRGEPPEEIADLFEFTRWTTHALQAASDITSKLAREVAGGDATPSGEVGLWLRLNGVNLTDVLALPKLRRLSNSPQRADWHHAEAWPLPESPWELSREQAAALRFTGTVLTYDGYRDLSEHMGVLRRAVEDDTQII